MLKERRSHPDTILPAGSAALLLVAMCEACDMGRFIYSRLKDMCYRLGEYALSGS